MNGGDEKNGGFGTFFFWWLIYLSYRPHPPLSLCVCGEGGVRQQCTRVNRMVFPPIAPFFSVRSSLEIN